jgi:thymidine kinase
MLCGLDDSRGMERGKTFLHWGPMFSGKTTAVMEHLKKAVYAGKRVIAVRHISDIRYDNTLVVSHDGQKMSAINMDTLEDPKCVPPDVEVIGIDEGHFQKGLAKFCEYWNERGVEVCVAALHTTFDNKLWPEVVQLLPLCSATKFHHAVCVLCGNTQACRTKNLARMPETGVLVGGEDMYVSTCFTCQSKEVSEDILLKRKEIIERIKDLFPN